MVRRSLAVFALCLGTLLLLSGLAMADTGSIIEPQHEPPTNADGWQAGTCLTDEPSAGVHCGPQTGSAFYKEAAGHPPIGFTNYIIKHTSGTGKVEPAGITVPIAEIEEPAGDQSIKTLRVDLPPGLTVNPNATPKCSLAEFENKVGEFHVPTCKEGTIVGREEITLVTTIAGVPAPSPPFPAANVLPKGFIIPPSEASGTKVPVYNLQPKPGEPALFGFVAAGKEVVFLETEVSWENDFHESFTIRLPVQAPPFATLVSRLVNFGQEAGNLGLVEEGNGTYINNPTTCFDPTEAANEHLYSTWFRAESYGEEDPEFPAGSSPFEAKVEENNGTEGVPVQQEGCDTVPFEPGIEVGAGTNLIDSPSPATVETTLEYLTGTESEQQESHLRKAEVTLPAGMGLNPSGSGGLVACTDAQFKKGVRSFENECPANSVIGSVEITSPPLAAPLTGSIYVGEQKSSDPSSGEEFRILVEAKEEEEGIDVRLVGHTKADPTTGQLTTVFDEQEVGPLAGELPQGLPQVPFEAVVLRFDGPHTVLTSPPTCAKAESSGRMEPWARPGEQVPVTSEFTLSTDPGGGSCPTTLAARKFTPSYTANTDSQKAGSYSPFRVSLGRSDGQQEVKLVNVTLPKGLTGKLAGIPYCSEEAIAAAAAKSGKAEQASPSCTSASQVGTTTTSTGTGTAPISLPGKVYLAGPYKGAPLSLAVITPAVSGPFDLGTVVVRVALNVNPITAQVNPVSDAIPDVFGGVKLDIRKIDFDIDRSEFMVNPTNCAAQATSGAIDGSGGNPADSSAWSSYAVNAPFQASGCNGLGFKPKLHVRLKGGTKRTQFPQLRAVLEARKGDANVARTALNLPHAFLVEQGHMGKVCTRPELASHTCPSNTIYGHAEAKTPLLSGKLSGPVYLVPGGHVLPDLVADLRGQVEIQLHGVISSKHGGIKTVFNETPDVPLTKFILDMKGGKKGLIVNSAENTCDTKREAILNIKGQNGKKVKTNHFRLNIVSCKKGKK
jgi:hypothetical protein